MGKKRGKKSNLPAAPSVEEEEADSGNLAAQLLAEMGLATEPEEPQQSESGHTKSESSDVASREPRRNRRREKLAQREKERACIVAEAESEAATAPDKRQIEIEAMASLIKREGLIEHDITPDGHCLFASIADQLSERYNLETSVKELRHRAAKYMRHHPDDFAPYLFDDKTGDLINIVSYTNALENTAIWGGELEIKALSQAFHVPIIVYMASQPKLVISSQFEAQPLRLAYYMQIYNLGAHYNSLRDCKFG